MRGYTPLWVIQETLKVFLEDLYFRHQVHVHHDELLKQQFETHSHRIISYNLFSSFSSSISFFALISPSSFIVFLNHEENITVMDQQRKVHQMTDVDDDLLHLKDISHIFKSLNHLHTFPA